MEQKRTGTTKEIPSTNENTPRIAFLTTGGSIDKTYSPHTSSFEIEDPIIEETLNDGEVKFRHDVFPILKKDSLEMTDEDRCKIRNAVENCDEERIIITHGTDTIVETGRCLQGIRNKVIVLTGAFKPIRLKHTDGILNLGMAIAAVQILPPGVYIAINGMVSPVEAAQKDRENQFFRFAPMINGAKAGGRLRAAAAAR